MASYSFAMPIMPGTVEAWKGYAAEMKGARNAEYKASRQRAGLDKEEVWLQSTPMGDFAVVHFETGTKKPDEVFGYLMTSQDPFDQWFREKILVEVHGVDLAGPPPPMNQEIFIGP